MGWKTLACLYLPCLAALVNPVAGAPAPITDVSVTTVDVHLEPQDCMSHAPRFDITVHRVDDLVSDTTGALVAQRDQRFGVSFEVAYGGGDSLLLNGIPVRGGTDNAVVTMKAAVAVDARHLDELQDASGTAIRTAEDVREAATAAFDVGLATVAVSVHSTTFLVRFNSGSDPIPVRRFALSEKVIEVDGKEVLQTNVGEQVFYVAPDGSFVGLSGRAAWASVDRKTPGIAAADAPDAAALENKTAASKALGDGCDGVYAGDWFGRLTPFQCALVLSSLAVPAMLAAWVVTALFSRFARHLRAGKRGSAGDAPAHTGKSLHPYRQLSTGGAVAVPPSYNDVRDAEKVHAADSKDGAAGEGETERDPLCQ